MSDNKRESGLEKLKRIARDNGITGAWARTQLMGRDPEWMRVNFPAHFPPAPAAPAIPVAAPVPERYQADIGAAPLAHAIAFAITGEEKTKDTEDLAGRVLACLRDCEAKDIPS